MNSKIERVDKIEFYPNSTELHNNIYNIIKSSIVYIQQLLLFNENKIKNNELYENDIQPLIDNIDKWIKFIKKPEYLKIIYYLITNGICYASGLRKVFGGETTNIIKKLDNLRKFGIIQEIKSKNEDIKYIYSHKEVFRIDDWHFQKTIFYELTQFAKFFYRDIDFSKFLPPHYTRTADNWKQKLSKIHKEIKKKKVSEEDAIREIGIKYWKHVKDIGTELDIRWFNGQVERFQRKGAIFNKKTIEIMNDIITNQYG